MKMLGLEVKVYNPWYDTSAFPVVLTHALHANSKRDNYYKLILVGDSLANSLVRIDTEIKKNDHCRMTSLYEIVDVEENDQITKAHTISNGTMLYVLCQRVFARVFIQVSELAAVAEEVVWERRSINVKYLGLYLPPQIAGVQQADLERIAAIASTITQDEVWVIADMLLDAGCIDSNIIMRLHTRLPNDF